MDGARGTAVLDIGEKRTDLREIGLRKAAVGHETRFVFWPSDHGKSKDALGKHLIG